MELRQIRYFIAVAEHLSYAKAAKELHVSISPLSRQIRQLEDEFGVRLFVRDRRRVALTDVGHLFLRESKSLIRQAAHLSEQLRLAKAGELGAVRVGVAVYLGDTVGNLVQEHSRLHPAVDVQCHGIYSSMQNVALREGQIDVGFLRAPIDAALASAVLYEEPLVALMGKTNRLAGRKSLRMEDLAEETLFVPERNVGQGLLEKSLELFARAGIQPRTTTLPADPMPHGEVHKVLLAANKGIFIVGEEHCVRIDNANVAAVVPIDDPEAKIEVHVAWRKQETSAAVLALVDTARRSYSQLPSHRGTRCAATRLAS